MRYTIEQFTTPTTYDDPWQPDPNWMESPFFYGKSWKTEQGATRALNKLVQLPAQSQPGLGADRPPKGGQRMKSAGRTTTSRRT